MKTVRSFAFLLILGLATLGRSSLAFDYCPLTIGGTGTCADMEIAIGTVTGAGTTCQDYCEFVPYCNPEAYSCMVNWDNGEYCSQSPNDDWWCDCICYG
jgi:hypothetical protein